VSEEKKKEAKGRLEVGFGRDSPDLSHFVLILTKGGKRRKPAKKLIEHLLGKRRGGGKTRKLIFSFFSRGEKEEGRSRPTAGFAQLSLLSQEREKRGGVEDETKSRKLGGKE